MHYWWNYTIHRKPSGLETRINLNFCKTNELESNLTELINLKKKKKTECNWLYSQASFYELRWVLKKYDLHPLLKKLVEKNMNAFFLGKFNINLFDFKKHKLTNEFGIIYRQIYFYHISYLQLEYLAILKFDNIHNID